MFAVVVGSLRGTRTFIRGWQQADTLGIRNVIVVWSSESGQAQGTVPIKSPMTMRRLVY